MKQINSFALLFLLAFAVSIFIFITKLFTENKDQDVTKYRVEIKEVKNRL
jgi:hypothetical protein